MTRVSRLTTLVIASIVLAGCGVGFTRIKTVVDKEFDFSEVSKVQVGMSEAQVIKLLGKPTVFGVDEQGRDFLLYEQTRQSAVSGMANPPGAVAAQGSVSLKGFEVRVRLKDGIVQNVGYMLYQE